MHKLPVVYILSNKRNGTLYTGVTSNLAKRLWEHKNDLAEGFTKKHKVHMLVYYECHDEMLNAITHERQSRNGNATGKFA